MTSLLPSQKPPARPRAWLAFFVVLVILGVVGMVLPVVYNLGQQLTPDDLAQARTRRREAGPADYDLTFSIRYDREALPERHIVLVRDGKPVFAVVEDEIIHAAPALGATLGLAALGAPRQRPRDIPALFGHIAELLHDQEESGGKNFLVAVFDPKIGFPRRLIRRVRRSSTREEWDVRLWKAGELEEKGGPHGGHSGGQ